MNIKIALLLGIFCVSTAGASECTDAQQAVSDRILHWDLARSSFTKVFLDCSIHGPDDKKFTALVGAYRLGIGESGLNLKGKDACFHTPKDLMDFIDFSLNQLGKTYGKAAIACSEEAQRIIRNPKLSRRKMKKELDRAVMDPVREK